MVLQIGGVDISPYIEAGGYSYTLNDLEASDSGRTMDGTMHRARISQKVKLDITCRSMRTAEISAVLTAINPAFVEATYLDPKEGGMRTATFYSNNKPATCLVQNEEGEELWNGISFPLVER